MAFVGEIIQRFEQRGYFLRALKIQCVDKCRDTLQRSCRQATLPSSPSPVELWVWEGQDGVAQGRKMLGTTNPLESAPSTCVLFMDPVDSAKTEIALWFPEGVWGYTHDWIYK